jgi:predicted dehydrogenase
MLRIGVIGLGHWGPNHIRNFYALPNVKVVAAVDLDGKRRQRVQQMYHDIELSETADSIWNRRDIDAVVVATPTATHYQLVKAALESGKHVLCEKPLAAQSRDAWDLVRLAQAANRVLMVGNVFLFNPGVEYTKGALDRKVVGEVYYLNAVRTNLGPFRYDVNAAWDLASHDIYILNYLICERPATVAATGGCYLLKEKKIEDIVFLTLEYPSGVLGHVHVSWLDPRKVRQITVVGEQKMILWDDLGSPGPVTIFDRKVDREPVYTTFGEFQLLAREGDVVYPRILAQEPLAAQAKAFVAWVLEGKVPDGRGTAQQGAEVVDVLEAVTRSLQNNGRKERVEYGQ